MIRQIEELGHLSLKDNDVESLFSADDEPSKESVFRIDVGSVYSDDDSIYQISSAEEPQASKPPEEINIIRNLPQIPMMILTSKYAKPIKVIAFLDTGADSTIMNPKVLPKEWWMPHSKIFYAANRQEFSVNLISKPITL